MKDRKHNSGKGSKNTRTHRNNLKSGSTIGNQKKIWFSLLDLDACVGFSFVFHFEVDYIN